MSPPLAFTGQNMAGEIELMQPLHDDDLDAGGRVIDAAAESGVKTQVDGFTLGLADGLLRSGSSKMRTSPPRPVAVACIPVENMAPREEFS